MPTSDASYTPPPLFRNWSFHLLWSSTFASGFGDRMAMFAVITMIGFGGTGEEASIQAGADFFFFLPYIFWAPIAGWLADRLPRKWLMFAADELRGLIIIAALVLLPQAGGATVDETNRWVVWTVMLMIGVCAATFTPVRLAMVPNVVGYASLQRANAVVVNMGVIGNLFGAVFGGMLTSAAADSGGGDAVRLAIALSAGAYIVSGWFWAFVTAPQHRSERKETFKQAMVGLTYGGRYALTHKPVLMLIILATLVWTGTSVYIPALGALSNIYGGAQATLGILMGLLGLGMLIGGAVMAFANSRLGSELWITLGTMGIALFMAMQMLIPVFAVGVVCALGIGFFAGLLLVALNTLIQRITPDFMRGRIFGAKEFIQESGKVAASLAIWRIPGSNAWMSPITLMLAAALAAVSIFALLRYAMSGPTGNGVLNLLWRFARLWTEALHRVQVKGRHRVPHEGPVLLVSNHTAGLDPMLIQARQPRMVTWLMDKEFRLWRLNVLWKRYPPILVDREKADPAAARAAIEQLKDGGIVGIFPEAGLNRERDGLLEFRAGVGLIARRGGATVVPVFVCGTPNCYHALSSYFTPSHAKVTFGEPFHIDVIEASDREAIVAEVRRRIEAMMHEAAERGEWGEPDPGDHAADAKGGDDIR